MCAFRIWSLQLWSVDKKNLQWSRVANTYMIMDSNKSCIPVGAAGAGGGAAAAAAAAGGAAAAGSFQSLPLCLAVF